MQRLQAIDLGSVQAHNNAAIQGLGQVGNIYGNMDKAQKSKTVTQATVGGAAMSALGGAGAGAMVGAQVGGSVGGGWGAAAGAVVGLAGYYL